MEEKSVSNASGEGNNVDCQAPALLENGESGNSSLAFKLLPASLLSLVGEYLSSKKDLRVKYTFLGEHPITLCLSWDVNSKLNSWWHVGFLSPECPLQEQNVAKIDKRFSISDHENCLDIFAHENSNYYRVVIDVLVVNLSRTASDSHRALDKLRRTIAALQGQLSRVKRIVISIAEYASCSFFVQDPIDKATGLSQLVDHQQAVHQIIDDLQTWCKANQTLTLRDLFAFYVKDKAKPASEMYLAKFIISLKHPLCQTLFKEEALDLVSDKIMWIYSIKTLDDFENIEQDMIRLCHLIHFDASTLEHSVAQRLGDRLRNAFDYRDNRFIERIIINSDRSRRPLELPRPSGPLTNTTSFSALIEITLKGHANILPLTQLNNGFFPNLTHLSVIGGSITGHLDSQSVPRLKTIILELGSTNDLSDNPMAAISHKYAQSLIRTDCPWQLAGSQYPGGWSLASYNTPTPNPQNEEKAGSLFSTRPLHLQPFIGELILCMRRQRHIDEWQSQLNGDSPPEAAPGDQNNGLLVWAPERVQKISVFCTSGTLPRVELKEEIPGKTRILTSLVSRCVKIDIDGASLPHLKSLQLNYSQVTMSGSFPLLQTLTYKDAELTTPWKLDAPSLQSLSCHRLSCGPKLSLNPQLLPHLSYLRIESFEDDPAYCPNILVDGDGEGLSRIKHVVLEQGMTRTSSFNQYQVHHVLHLELEDVNPLKLPICWSNTEWQCETFAISLHAKKPHDMDLEDTRPIVVLPGLPRVKKLNVRKLYCRVLLNSEMSQLVECTLASPEMLGPNLKCPALRCICFLDKLSTIDRKKCLDRATYEAIGARPIWVCLRRSGEVHRMSWDN